MASRTYPKEPTIESFGLKLLQSGDLDPLYIALVGADLDEKTLWRFLFAYWCCYHAGAAAYLADCKSSYWYEFLAMARNETLTPIGGRWPRGHERRHFRGDKAVNAVHAYMKRFREPEYVHDLLIPPIGSHEGETIRTIPPLPFERLRRRIMELPQFGPWIAFKVADMIDRVVGIPVDFTAGDVFMFDSPREAALETAKLWIENEQPPIVRSSHDERLVRGVAETLIQYFHEQKAPPRYDRPVNIQEIETILCKWKSHQSGSYPLGLDSEEIRHGLKEWAKVSATAQRLLLTTPAYANVV
jgi:Alpha-glutamyl/putrescinyl thymine pyrophosphorylase clade 2